MEVIISIVTAVVISQLAMKLIDHAACKESEAGQRWLDKKRSDEPPL